MNVTGAEITALVGSYMWPFIRIGSMLMVVPIFGARALVPVRIRLGLAIILTILVAPLLPPMPAVEPLSLDGILITMHQVLLGIAMGFILQLVLSALVVGGHSIAMSMGLGFAQFLDPNGVSVPVVSQFLIIMGTLLFVVLNGHLVTIQVLFESFNTMPVGPTSLDTEALMQIALWGSKMFVGALLIALPALITIKLINIAFGVMSRAAPTLNLFAVGFPVTMFVGFIVIFLTLPNLLPRFTSIVMEAFNTIQLISGSEI
jgi:flagellar biosynthetic protein FliR